MIYFSYPTFKITFISGRFAQIFQTRLISQSIGKKTCLYNLHLKHGGKMVDFAGFTLPVNYDLSIGDSVRHTRSNASIFDCSHMMQTIVSGEDRIEFLESLTPADVVNLPNNHGSLSVFTNNRGGIMDDLILTKIDSHIILVTNAGCRSQDLKHLQENALKWRNKGKNVYVTVLECNGLIAVQGPMMVDILQPQTEISLNDLHFMQTANGKVCGVDNCRVTRCGYTGEDGVEISVEGSKADWIVEQLLKSPFIKLAGLGARDVLRLEAGLCLYGNDISEDTTPVEAALSFVIAKRRRKTLGFPGAERIIEQLEKKNFSKKRVGIVSEGGRVPRSHMPILDPLNKATVGFITSGSPSPTTGKNIAMGYVDKPDSTIGKVLQIDFGSKSQEVSIAKLPFVETKYYTFKAK